MCLAIIELRDSCFQGAYMGIWMMDIHKILKDEDIDSFVILTHLMIRLDRAWVYT